ncbi:unnamed protein product [Rhodiola kirilowii]
MGTDTLINWPIPDDLMRNQKEKPSVDKSAKMKLKLLVDNKSSKVLFAEADKEFVDFLLGILALPLGTVTRLLKQNDGMVGSLGVLYNSVESLSESYIQPNLSKEAVLCPKVQLPFADNQVSLLKCEGVEYAQEKLYRCSNCRSSSNVTNNPQTRCPSFSYLNPSPFGFSSSPAFPSAPAFSPSSAFTSSSSSFSVGTKSSEFTSSAATEKGKGYVKGLVTYMVMDDLAVKPMSTISSISLLNTFNIKDVGVLKEKTVIVGMAEGLRLLRASLHSKTVLTDVFLSKAEA